MRTTLLGLSADNWRRLELTSTGAVLAITLREAMERVGKHGVLGLGKSKKLENASKLGMSSQTWNSVTAFGSVLALFVLVKNGIDLLETHTKLLEEDQIMPGRGVLFTQARKINLGNPPNIF